MYIRKRNLLYFSQMQPYHHHETKTEATQSFKTRQKIIPPTPEKSPCAVFEIRRPMNPRAHPTLTHFGHAVARQEVHLNRQVQTSPHFGRTLRPYTLGHHHRSCPHPSRGMSLAVSALLRTSGTLRDSRTVRDSVLRLLPPRQPFRRRLSSPPAPSTI